MRFELLGIVPTTRSPEPKRLQNGHHTTRKTNISYQLSIKLEILFIHANHPFTPDAPLQPRLLYVAEADE